MPDKPSEPDAVTISCLVLLSTTFHPDHGTLMCLVTAEKYQQMVRDEIELPTNDVDVFELADFVIELDHETLHSLIPALVEHHNDHVALEAQTAAQARLN